MEMIRQLRGNFQTAADVKLESEVLHLELLLGVAPGSAANHSDTH